LYRVGVRWEVEGHGVVRCVCVCGGQVVCCGLCAVVVCV
jgi:hypothetical protein